MPLSPSDTRTLLARLGHRPRHGLGQNFLVDGNIVRKSLELAGLQAGDRVVEIGPGLGTLTGALLEAQAEVWAVEKDDELLRYLQETLAPRYPQTLHLMAGDAVELPLAGCPGGEFKIIANLPYAIATPWLDAVLQGPLPRQMILMLQREAAQRYAAAPGTKAFGAISIFLQSAYDVKPGHRVAAACFHPRPDVESHLLHLVLKPQPAILPAPARALIRRCFQNRRKQIGGLGRDVLPGSEAAWLEGLARAGISPQARAEGIPVAAWHALVQDLPKLGLS